MCCAPPREAYRESKHRQQAALATLFPRERIGRLEAGCPAFPTPTTRLETNTLAETLAAVFGIVLIDLVLSGDNAIVIGMAAHRLPPRQRRFAILFGGAAAIGLRIFLTAAAAVLLQVPGIEAIGGALLLWIAFRLLGQEEEPHDAKRPAASIREAIVVILLADFVMSLDNVLGVAAASHGDLPLLFFGLGLSVAILMAGGSLVATLINRLWWLAYLGAAVIAWTGTRMFLEDPFVVSWIHPPTVIGLAIAGIVAVAVVATAHYWHRGRLPAEAI